MSEALRDTYRHIVILEDGARILLRPFASDDVEGLYHLYSSGQPEDLVWFSDIFASVERVRAWAGDLDYTHSIPLLALLNGRIVGDATLERRDAPHNHIGDVRVFLARDFRGRGLGTQMLRTLIDLARKGGVHWLQAEVFASKTKVIRAFESLGFEQQCVLEGYFMLPTGDTEDISIMRMRLLKPTDAF